MKNIIIPICISIVSFFSLSFTHTSGQIISSLTYDNIKHTDPRQELKEKFPLGSVGVNIGLEITL